MIKIASENLRTTIIKTTYQRLLSQPEIYNKGVLVGKDGKFFPKIPQKLELRDEIRKNAADYASLIITTGNPEELARSLLKLVSAGQSFPVGGMIDLSGGQREMPKIFGVKEFPTCLSVAGDPHFVRGIFPKDKTPIVYNPYQNFAPAQSEFVFYVDEFGGRYLTIISTERSKRPSRSKQVGTLSYEFAVSIYRENVADEGFGLRLMVARMTTSPELLEEILEKDPDSRIRFEAAANPHASLSARKKGCPFCNQKQWGTPAETFDDLVIGTASNPFRFEVDHDVYIVIERFHNLAELEEKHFVDFIRLASRRAKDLAAKRKDISGVNFGMNYGTGRVEEGSETNSTYASFQHIHAQLTSIHEGTFNPGDEIADFIESWPYNIPFFDAYIKALEKDGLILKKYGDRAYLVVPRAPMARHQLRILTSPRVGNFLEMEVEDEFAVGEAFHDAMVVLQGMKLPSFNVISFAKRFSDKRIGQPLLIDILPRGGIAFMELGGMWVVDSFPETTAAEAKRILKGEYQSEKSSMRSILANGTLDEIKKYRPDEIHEDPLAAHVLYGNPHQGVRYYASSTELGFEVPLYGKDISRFRNLPDGLIVQFGKNSWDSIKRGDPVDKAMKILNKIANKMFALLSLEVLRVILDEKMADKLKEDGNRLILDSIIERLAKATGKSGIVEWHALCKLSREEIKKLLLSL